MQLIKHSVLFFVFSGGFIFCTQKQNFEIVPIKPYVVIDTSSENGKNKYKYFLVKDFMPSKQKRFSSIDSFAFKNLDYDYSEYTNYSITFFRKTKDFDENFKNTTSDNILLQGDEMIYNYFWKKGRFAGLERYEDGQLIHFEYIGEDGKIMPPANSKLKN